MDNAYGYDVVSNVLSVVNKAAIPEKGKAGGQMSYNYTYDALYCLSTASGTYKGADNKAASYTLSMGYDNMHRITSKKQHLSQTGVQFEGTLNAGYELAYTYGKDAGRKFQLDNVRDINYRTEETPTESMNINNGHKYTYDLNGNLVYINTSRVKRDGKEDEKATEQKYRWDEENHLMVLSDNSKTSRYTYNAAGERIMKSYGTMEGVYINGAPQGITLTNVDFRLHQDKMSKLFCAWFALKFHETDNFTLYPASIISINKNRFTKHYFIGDKRIASRIGTGLFNNVYGRNGSYITAGQQDNAERMNQIQKQKEAYYKQQGIAPGVPTMKGAYGDPENTKRGYNSIIDTLGNHDVPQGWIQTPRPNTTPNTNPGPPVSWNDPSNPDDPQAGYGYIPNDTTKEETFFYHSDHLGSTSYITDDHANITQYDAYLPYGELLVDEHSSSEDLPYKFNGKQFDEETGLYYYGARYMDPKISMWLGVDPLMEKYPNVTGYCYTMDNPIKFIDPNGKETYVIKNKTGTYTVVGGILNNNRGIYIASKDKSGKYTIKGEMIGISTSTTTFYNTDANKGKGGWAIGAQINPNDKSGINFLNKIVSSNVTLGDYMNNARTNHPYDFKVTNGGDKVISNTQTYIYRGVPIGKDGFGYILYSSGRDIGNMAAGIVAAKNGIPWSIARAAFDAYQTKNNMDKHGYSLDNINVEGKSTRNAEYYGWSQIYKYSNTKSKASNLWNSIKRFFSK